MQNKSRTTTTIVFVAASSLISNIVAADTSADPTPTSINILPADKSTETSITSTNPPADNTASAVKRSQFTTAIVNREPTDNVVTLTNNSDKIYFFTELSNLKGHEIAHRWKYENKLMAEIKFEVASDRWRVFSSKKLKPGWVGQWSVELVDENGTPLDVENLQIVDAQSN